MNIGSTVRPQEGFYTSYEYSENKDHITIEEQIIPVDEQIKEKLICQK